MSTVVYAIYQRFLHRLLRKSHTRKYYIVFQNLLQTLNNLYLVVLLRIDIVSYFFRFLLLYIVTFALFILLFYEHYFSFYRVLFYRKQPPYYTRVRVRLYILSFFERQISNYTEYVRIIIRLNNIWIRFECNVILKGNFRRLKMECKQAHIEAH